MATKTEKGGKFRNVHCRQKIGETAGSMMPEGFVESLNGKLNRFDKV